MLKKIIAAALLAVLPGLCSAAVYDCVVKQKGSKGAYVQELWSGKIVLKDGAPIAGEVFIIKKDGSGVSLSDLSKGASDSSAMEAALKPLDGLLVIGLRRQGTRLDVNLGHVETANKKDSAPMDVDASASGAPKEIGVTDARRGLWASCRTP